jgi:hypothetical protein
MKQKFTRTKRVIDQAIGDLDRRIDGVGTEARGVIDRAKSAIKTVNLTLEEEVEERFHPAAVFAAGAFVMFVACAVAYWLWG